MGDYNADPDPATAKMRQLTIGYGLAPGANIKADQFSTSTSNKVYTFNRKIGSTRLKFLVDPSQIPA